MIKFQLTINDIIAFNKHYMKKNASFFQKYLHWIIMLFFVALMIANLHEHNAKTESYLIIIPVVAAIIFVQRLFSNYLRKKALINYVKKNPLVIGDREFVLNDKALIVKVGSKDTEYPFNSFIRLDEGKEHYFAYVSQQTAVIIPKRLLSQFEETAIIIEKLKANQPK